MNCPRCSKPLNAISYEGVTVDSCNSCKGNFLDKGELLQINKARSVTFSEQERASVEGARCAVITDIKRTDKPLKCPKCQVDMGSLNYAYSSGIIVDLCPKCEGLWLDKGELEQVQIVIEEWEKKDPQIRNQFIPALKAIKEEITSMDRSRDEKLTNADFIKPLVKAIIYKVI